MGYRSQVVLVVGKEIMPQFMVTMAKSPEARKLCWGEADQTVKDYDGEGNFLFSWNCIKWYDSFEEIRAIEDFLDWACSESIEVDGKTRDGDEFIKFLRTGEELDDNEQRGWGFDDVWITRRIEF